MHPAPPLEVSRKQGALKWLTDTGASPSVPFVFMTVSGQLVVGDGLRYALFSSHEVVPDMADVNRPS